MLQRCDRTRGAALYPCPSAGCLHAGVDVEKCQRDIRFRLTTKDDGQELGNFPI